MILRRCSKWQYQREKYPTQDETADVHIGNWLCPVWLSVLTVRNLNYLTEYVVIAVSIREKKL